MKWKIILTLSFLFTTIITANAQTHTYKMGCRYFKPPIVNGKAVSGEAICPACAKQREDERKARKQEDKRRLDAEATVQKQKLEKEKTEVVAKQEADIKARQANEVKITIATPTEDKTKKKKTETTQKEINASVAGKLYSLLYYSPWIWAINRYNDDNTGIGRFLLTSKGDTLRLPFQEYQISAMKRFSEDEIKNNTKSDPYFMEILNSFPSNSALIFLKEGMDIINSKGDRFFNEKGLFVYHLAKDYFMKVKFPYAFPLSNNRGASNEYYISGASIINIKTKEEVQVPIPDNSKGSVRIYMPLSNNGTSDRDYVTEHLPAGWKHCVFITNGDRVVCCYLDENLNPKILEFNSSKYIY